MSKVTIKFDSAGISQWMKDELAAPTRQAAEALASRVRDESDADVTVRHYTTDRPHSVVMVHDGGAAREAKHGHLKRAATGLGLQVGPPGGRS